MGLCDLFVRLTTFVCLDNRGRYKAIFTKYRVKHTPKCGYFRVINADKDYSIFSKQIPCEVQPGIHHVQPL